MRGETIVKSTSTQRLYYSIKEVGELFDEEQHILRYWEREFDCLRPSKNRAGNRTYTEKDLDVIRVIKKLLRVDRLPVSEARAFLHRGVTPEMVQESVRALMIHRTIDVPAATALRDVEETSIPAKPMSTKTSPEASTKEVTARIPSSDARQLIDVLKSIVRDLEELV
jgi:DNA-binding transcriptional MerR regulator